MIGRPTNCTEEVIALAWGYIDKFSEYGHAVPSVVGLCSVINRSRASVYLWAKDDTGGFSDILAKINEAQELVTFNKSLTGEYNATIAKLLLGKHGYHDKSDVSATVTELSHEQWLDSLE